MPGYIAEEALCVWKWSGKTLLKTALHSGEVRAVFASSSHELLDVFHCQSQSHNLQPQACMHPEQAYYCIPKIASATFRVHSVCFALFRPTLSGPTRPLQRAHSLPSHSLTHSLPRSLTSLFPDALPRSLTPSSLPPSRFSLIHSPLRARTVSGRFPTQLTRLRPSCLSETEVLRTAAHFSFV